MLPAIARHLTGGPQPVATAAATAVEPSLDLTGGALRAHRGSYERSGQGVAAGAIGWEGKGKMGSTYQLSTRDNTPVPPTNTFGVSSVIPGLGILPKKVRTMAEAAECVRRDGAVILTGLPTAMELPEEAYFDAALSLPKDLFGDSLIAATPPVAVGIRHKQDAAEMKEFYSQHWGEEIATALPPWEPNCPHTDGEAYGDRFPPYLFLLFGHQSEDGGENALVDSYGVVDAMANDPALGEQASKKPTWAQPTRPPPAPLQLHSRANKHRLGCC